jgi:hypothetical protein
MVTFLVRGEEGARLANGRAATVFGPGVSDRVTNDGTEVSVPSSGGQLGQAIDKIRGAIAKEAKVSPEHLVLIGARRLPRWEIVPRAASIIFTASRKSVRSNVHCIDTGTGAIGFVVRGDSNHYLAYPQGSGSPREYDPEEMKNVQTLTRPCFAVDEANEIPPAPVEGVADVLTDGFANHFVLHWSEWTLCNKRKSTTQISTDDQLGVCVQCNDLYQIVGSQA